MRIAFSGSHSVGKTTSVLEKAHEMKMIHPTKSVGIFMENARHSPFKINKDGNSKSQMWIFCSQLQHELFLEANYDIVICDRTIIDSIAYTRINGGGDDELALAMIEMAKHHIESYDKIYFKTIINNDYLVEDGVRDGVDRSYRMTVEHHMVNIYDELLKCREVNIEYI